MLPPPQAAKMKERDLVCALNYELRKERRPFAMPDGSGHVAFQIDAKSYWFWVAIYPELGASDPIVARKAWLWFLNTDNGRRFKVNPTEGKRMPVNGIIIR